MTEPYERQSTSQFRFIYVVTLRQGEMQKADSRMAEYIAGWLQDRNLKIQRETHEDMKNA